MVDRPERPPVVSVVIIFCNERDYLQEAIDSVFAQTFTDWELILVDDGSSDGSELIAAKSAEDNPQVRYFQHPGGENRGMSASRNLGVAQARGTYIAYLDGDDVFAPNKLEVQLGELADHPRARLTYAPVVRWVSWNPDSSDHQDGLYGLEGDRFTLESDRLFEPPELVCLFLVHKDLVPTGEMFERSLFNEVGGANDDFRTNYEDGVVLTKMLLRAPAYCSPTPTYYYRQHPSSSTAVGRAAGLSDDQRQRFLEWVAGYLSAEGIRDVRVRTALWRARLPRRQPRIDKVVRGAIRATNLARKGTKLASAHIGLAAAGRLRRMALADITDEFGFSLGHDGWNCYSSILRHYDEEPQIAAENSDFGKFFQSIAVNEVADLNDLFDLGSDRPGFGDLPRFWLGTYPWGSLIGDDTDESNPLGPAFGWAHDASTGADTATLWGVGRTLWYEPRDLHTIRNEWEITVDLYSAIRDGGYSPLKARGFPKVTVLERADGHRRGVIVDGHHRLAILAHQEKTSATVQIERVIRESEASEWVGVRSGVCTEAEARAFFDAFFRLNGRERFEAAMAGIEP